MGGLALKVRYKKILEKVLKFLKVPRGLFTKKSLWQGVGQRPTLSVGYS